MPNIDVRESGVALPEGPAFADNLTTLSTAHLPTESDGLIAAARSVRSGEFLLDRYFMPGISDLIKASQFVDIPEHGLTREESGREVGLSFGQLILNSDDDGQHSIYATLKPFDSDQDAAHEYAAAGYIASGNIRGVNTFPPLGFYRFPDTDKIALITYYNHPVRSLDTILWNPDIMGGLDQPGNMLIAAKAMGRAAVTLVRLHNNNMGHGDAQAKNMAWNVFNGPDVSFVIDLETASQFSPDPEEGKQTAKGDLAQFIGSTYRVADPDTVNESLIGHFTLPYSSGRGLDSPTKLSFEEIQEIVDTESTQQQQNNS